MKSISRLLFPFFFGCNILTESDWLTYNTIGNLLQAIKFTCRFHNVFINNAHIHVIILFWYSFYWNNKKGHSSCVYTCISPLLPSLSPVRLWQSSFQNGLAKQSKWSLRKYICVLIVLTWRGTFFHIITFSVNLNFIFVPHRKHTVSPRKRPSG